MYSGPHLIKIAIFTATRWECNAVRRAFTVDRVSTNAYGKCVIGRSGRANIFLFRTGVGPQNASQVSQIALAGQKWDLVISSGFAGALSSAPVGSIVIADQVLLDSSIQQSDQSPISIVCDNVFRDEALKIGRSMNEHTSLGRFVTVPTIISQAEEKQKLARRVGAIALDMESGVVGKVATDQGIPFVVMRTISDSVDEDLPVDFNLFFRPFGWIQGLGTVIMTPRCWAGFFRLRSQMVQASHQITHFFHEFFLHVGQLNDQHLHDSSTG